MQFSVKDAARWIKSNLALAKKHAVFYKQLQVERLVVCASPSRLLRRPGATG
jgi:hypothetical protein